MPMYLVVTPEYQVSPETEADPAEYGCDTWQGEARNQHGATMAAVKHWREQHRKRSKMGNVPYCETDENPFKGLKVTRANKAEAEGTQGVEP